MSRSLLESPVGVERGREQAEGSGLRYMEEKDYEVIKVEMIMKSP